MANQIDKAIDILISQYPKLKFTQKNMKNITAQIFKMPVPVLPHKRGDIILSAHGELHKSEPYHRHDYFLINYSYRGDYTQCIESENIILHQGEVLLFQPYVAHSLLPHATAGDSILSVRIRKELIFHSLLPLMPKHEALLHFFLSPLSGSPSDAHKYLILSGDDVLNASMHSVFKILILEYVNMLPGYDTLLDSALSMLFSLFSRCYCADNFKNPSSQSEILIDNILKYLSRNCATATLKDVAEKFNYHPNYLSTILQKETGKTFSELIREFRLKRACTLLQYSLLPIEEIAVLVGYPHSSNFYKTFKKEYHISPHQYRIQTKPGNG